MGVTLLHKTALLYTKERESKGGIYEAVCDVDQQPLLAPREKGT